MLILTNYKFKNYFIIKNFTSKVDLGTFSGKAIAPDHFWSNYIDHLNSELNHCNIVLYDKDNMTG